MEYLILQDSRKNKGMYIAMVDKTKCTEPKKFWTSVVSNALKFTSKEEASKICDKLKFNNPRVVPIDEATELVKPVYKRTHIKKRKTIFDMDMWEYKEWLGQGNDDWHEHNGGSGGIN